MEIIIHNFAVFQSFKKNDLEHFYLQFFSLLKMKLQNQQDNMTEGIMETRTHDCLTKSMRILSEWILLHYDNHVQKFQNVK